MAKRWTDEEVQMLRDLHLTTSREDLALILGRSAGSLYTKLHRLNLVHVGKSKSPETFEAEVFALEPDLVLVEKYINAKTSLRVKTTKCGHEWEIMPKNFLSNGSGRKCPVCLPGRSKSPEIFETEVFALSPDLVLVEKYVNKRTRIRVRSKTCEHEWEVYPYHFLSSQGTGRKCPVCFTKNSKSREVFEAELQELAPDLVLLEDYTHNKTRVRVKSKTCGHEWKILPSDFLSKGCGKVCPVCVPKGTSKAERELADFLERYTEVVRSDRKALAGREIDIYLPEFNLGIEYNGLYWHSEEFKSKDYHLKKTELAASKYITLIHVSEHEDMEIVKSQLLSLIGKNYALSAEKTEVKQLDYSPEDFLDTNHIQGAACSPSEVNLGLYLKDELVAVMVLSKPDDEGYEWELTRYCPLLDVTVVDGASKLLKYFIKSRSPKSILYYSDKRWGVCWLPESLGFTYLQSNAPEYLKLEERYHVYDCGQDVWVLTL